ncbi:MAG: hypothetical protein LBJ18_03310 [Rickettsiales bacterium]|nr:hypothetical protein [Rickettsiales bacterium]
MIFSESRHLLGNQEPKGFIMAYFTEDKLNLSDADKNIKGVFDGDLEPVKEKLKKFFSFLAGYLQENQHFLNEKRDYQGQIGLLYAIALNPNLYYKLREKLNYSHLKDDVYYIEKLRGNITDQRPDTNFTAGFSNVFYTLDNNLGGSYDNLSGAADLEIQVNRFFSANKFTFAIRNLQMKTPKELRAPNKFNEYLKEKSFNR